jgi:3-hydroxyacyl-[acyl-carrier-protein] dehydratase
MPNQLINQEARKVVTGIFIAMVTAIATTSGIAINFKSFTSEKAPYTGAFLPLAFNLYIHYKVLQDNFYTCHDVVRSEGEYNSRIEFNPDHSIFSGHFPGQPVVPGVCMMELIKELLQQQTGKTLMLRTAPNVKFLQLLTPAIRPSVHISFTATGEGYKVTASARQDDTIHFKLDGHYTIIQ